MSDKYRVFVIIGSGMSLTAETVTFSSFENAEKFCSALSRLKQFQVEWVPLYDQTPALKEGNI